MMMISITPIDAQPIPYLLWDSLYDLQTGLADWQMGTPVPAPFGTFNPGGLLVNDPIGTAVTVGLLTDAPCPPGHPLEGYANGDLRGYFGDGVDVRADLGEQPLGSLLWLLENATATQANARWAQLFATQALQPLINCKLATQITATANVIPAQNAMTLDVTIVGSFNGQNFNRTFAGIWANQARLAPAFPNGAP
jgi:phage gp46-like protein